MEMIGNTVKLYGKTDEVWKTTDEKGRDHVTQIAKTYREYYLDGTLKQKGVEDFSPERYESEIIGRQVWVWDGQKRNKGGYRQFDYKEYITFPRKRRKEVMELLKSRYPQSVLTELRGH